MSTEVKRKKIINIFPYFRKDHYTLLIHFTVLNTLVDKGLKNCLSLAREARMARMSEVSKHQGVTGRPEGTQPGNRGGEEKSRVRAKTGESGLGG